MDMLRTLKQLQRQSGGRLNVVSLSVDASRSDCDGALRVDSISWPNVCDGQMFDSRPLQQLGMMGVPDNIIVKDNPRQNHGIAEIIIVFGSYRMKFMTILRKRGIKEEAERCW